MAVDKHISDFGARLRDAREKRGLTLRVIADTTKISVRALEALERNDIAKLPGGIFSRAFVRAYACEVGLDPEATIAEFMTRFPDETVTQGHPRTRTIVDELESDSRKPGVWSVVGRVALVAGLAALALVAYYSMMGKRASAAPAQQRPAASLHRAQPRGRSSALDGSHDAVSQLLPHQ